MNRYYSFFLPLILSCLGLSTMAQNKPAFDGPSWKAPYHLEMEGWGIERFPIPVEFAPSIPYKGIEDLRFTKGWGEPTSPEYWSYAFLWLLDNSPVQNTSVIQKNLNAYFDGLIGRNISKRNIPKDLVTKTQAKLTQVKTEAGDLQTFTGTVNMLDYMAQKPMVLNAKIHVKKCLGSNKTIFFYQFSPRSVTDSVWLKLNGLWQGFKCGE